MIPRGMAPQDLKPGDRIIYRMKCAPRKSYLRGKVVTRTNEEVKVTLEYTENKSLRKLLHGCRQLQPGEESVEKAIEEVTGHKVPEPDCKASFIYMFADIDIMARFIL